MKRYPYRERDYAFGQLLLTLSTAIGLSQAGLAFAPGPDTDLLASGSADHTVRLWDAQTGACTRILQGHTANVSGVDWSVDGQRLTSGGSEGRVLIWDLQQGNSRVEIERAGVVSAVALSPR